MNARAEEREKEIFFTLNSQICSFVANFMPRALASYTPLLEQGIALPT